MTDKLQVAVAGIGRMGKGTNYPASSNFVGSVPILK